MDKDNINKKHISARVPEPEHRILVEAAKKSGLSLNQFLVQAGLEKAQSVLTNEGVVAASLPNTETVVNATDNLHAANNGNLTPEMAPPEDSTQEVSQNPRN
jgi:uncharacterized protein (DUF1778 family)